MLGISEQSQQTAFMPRKVDSKTKHNLENETYQDTLRPQQVFHSGSDNQKNQNGFLGNALENILNLVFPKDEHVRNLEVYTADDLREKLPQVPGHKSLRKDNTISLFDYHHPDVRQIIWEIKYKKNRRLAFICAQLLSEELLDYVYEKREFDPKAKFVLLPIPTSDRRLKQRGYNQTELVADYVKKMLPPLCYCKETLRRNVDKTSQTKKTRTEREKNVQDCFSVLKGQHLRDNFVIILDDVTTTGATLNEVCKQISQHSPKEILRLTIAH